MTTSRFGDAVRNYRKRLGVTQAELARRAGLDPTHLNRIEKGKRNPPHVATVLRVTEVLHLTRSEAEHLVELAGYDTAVLGDAVSLSYESPTMPDCSPACERLHMKLHELDEDARERFIEGILLIIDAFTASQRDEGGS